MAAAELLVSDHAALADGTAVAIRLIRPDDGPGLRAFHARLSPETIYWRYLCVKPALSTAKAEQLTCVESGNRVAYVAAHTENGQDDIVGVAQYDRLGAGHADEAEFAIVVEDRFQRRGVGTLLWRQLTTDAREHGVRRFVAVVHPDNYPMLSFLRRRGLKMDTKLYGGVMTVRVSL